MLPREPADQWEPFEVDRFTRRIGAELRSRLGPDTLVADAVNGVQGLWVGFTIEKDPYWLQADPTPLASRSAGSTWFVWVGIALLATVLGSVAIARLINQPLRELSFAASRIRDGEFDSRLDENTLTSEIREVNMGFNRMARELAKVEEDRAVMLAGISHDLRTPLARLRLEAEMSVADEERQAQHGARHRPARRHHRQVHGLRAPRRRAAAAGAPVAADRPRDGSRSATRAQIRIVSRVAIDTKVMADESSSAACSATCSRTRAATAARTDTGIARVAVSYARTGPWVIISVRDHGPGVAAREAEAADDAVLPRRRRAHRGHRRRPRAGHRREGGAAHGRQLRAGQRAGRRVGRAHPVEEGAVA